MSDSNPPSTVSRKSQQAVHRMSCSEQGGLRGRSPLRDSPPSRFTTPALQPNAGKWEGVRGWADTYRKALEK